MITASSQFPHFYALAWLHREDYARGGHVMIPVVDPSVARTAGLMTRHMAGLSALPFVAYASGVCGPEVILTAGLANLGMWLTLRRFSESGGSKESARRVFMASLLYLPAAMALFVRACAYAFPVSGGPFDVCARRYVAHSRRCENNRDTRLEAVLRRLPV